jgi:hypothetical protein
MPLETLVEGLLKGAVRLIIEVVVEVVVNITFRGTGWLILKSLRPRSEPADSTAAWTGAVFWMLVVAGLLVLWWSKDVGA